jgi:putative membrane protein
VVVEPVPQPRAAVARRQPRYSRFIFVTPPWYRSILYLFFLSAALALLVGFPNSLAALAKLFLVIFLLPALGAVLLTGPLASLLGGRFSLRRSALLALMAAGFSVPVLAVWRVVILLFPSFLPPLAAILLFAQAPVLWFRHMSLFGMSNPHHARTLPASLVQPILASIAIFGVYSSPPTFYLACVLFLVLGFLTCALLLRAADRPLRREFGVSGVAFIRPLFDHVSNRDPTATRALERFFEKFAVRADLRVTALVFQGPAGPKATIALPTVHPGPFGALGASDLPRKTAERLGPGAGIVFVPHTPCNHDLDLPAEEEVQGVLATVDTLVRGLGPPRHRRASPLVSPRDGSLARAQLLDDAVLVLASQAPLPTDDIAYAIADRLFAEVRARNGPVLAFVDAHNSYVEDEGDLPYGSPKARQMLEDALAAIDAAQARATTGPIRVGVAQRAGYSVGRHGIGPQGIEALVIEAAGTKTAYVLIDGNNLVLGARDVILAGIKDLVDAAEVMTTDNHVVHEVDGGINPVGERYPAEALRADVRETLEEALRERTPVEVRAGTAEVRNVPVLGPGWTVRLLTSLGDTLSMFANAFVTTFLLLLSTSMVILALLR